MATLLYVRARDTFGYISASFSTDHAFHSQDSSFLRENLSAVRILPRQEAIIDVGNNRVVKPGIQLFLKVDEIFSMV